MNSELNNLCLQVKKVAIETGLLILKERETLSQQTIESKSKNNFVTLVDKKAEESIVRALMQVHPGAGFLTEEETIKNEQKEFTWIIDPIDGTTNFIHGLPCFCISIGLLHNNELVLGMIYEPVHNECFYATKGNGAYLNGKKINVSQNNKVKDSLLVTGFPYHDEGKLSRFINLFEYFIKNSHGVRRLGSAAIDMAYVACGRFDAFYEYGLNPWDVAAGCIILQEAGGKISDFSNDNNYLFGKELIASNGLIHNELQEIIAQRFLSEN